MMYEHETLQDELDRRDGIPDYYDTMYLDGYDVNQICRAFDKVQRRKFRKIRQEKMAKREQQELERSIKAELEKAGLGGAHQLNMVVKKGTDRLIVKNYPN